MAQERWPISNHGERTIIVEGENAVKSARSVQLALGIVAALALAGCERKESAPAPEASASAPDAKPGIAVADAVLMLPVVAGRPGAAYFAVTNNGTAATSLAAVHIEGAGKTEMHETKGGKMEPVNAVDLAPGATAKFERGGKHIMVFDVTDTLTAAQSAEMTLTFSGGDKVSVPIKIEKMAGGMAH